MIYDYIINVKNSQTNQQSLTYNSISSTSSDKAINSKI